MSTKSRNVTYGTGMIAVVAIVSLVISAIDFLASMPESVRMEQDTDDTTTQPAAENSQTTNLEVIMEAQLFGTATRSGGQQVALKGIEAPETSLNLRLKGISLSENTARSSALIVGEDGKAKAYRVGDVLSGSAEVAGVYPDHVLLKVGGQFEALILRDKTRPVFQ